MKKIWMIFLLISSLVGCSTIQREESLSSKQFERLDLAMKQVRPLVDINQGMAKKVRVGDASPIFESDTVKGRFEVLGVKALDAAEFSFSVVGKCDCLGFRKWAPIPIVFLTTDDGTVVSEGKIAGPNGQTVSGRFPKAGIYRLFIAADGTQNGKKLSDVQAIYAYGGAVAPFSIPMVAHSVGDFDVVWMLEKK
jgi:hypothetical protein